MSRQFYRFAGCLMALIAVDITMTTAYGRGGAPGIGGGGRGGGGPVSVPHAAPAAPHIQQAAPRIQQAAPHIQQAAPRIQQPAMPRVNTPQQPFVNRSPSMTQPAIRPQVNIPQVRPNVNANANVNTQVRPNLPNNVVRPNVQPNQNPNLANRPNLNVNRPIQNPNLNRLGNNPAIHNPTNNNPITNTNRPNLQPNRNGWNGQQPNTNQNSIVNQRNNVVNRNNFINNNDRAQMSNRGLGGNQIRVGNQSVNIANTNYRPSYNRHPFYHGYWNGNWGGNRGWNRGWNGGWGSPGWGYGFAPGYAGYSGYGGGYGGYGGGYGGYGGYGPYGYWGRPLGWGLGAWGLGSLLYSSGYLGYSNPYYGSYAGSGYDYSQPIQIAYDSYDPGTNLVDSSVPADSGTATVATNNADSMLNDATAAFKQGDYDAALDIANKAIAQNPGDAVLHEFRALTLFAKKDYRQAAATLHSVLAVGPGWDWTTMSSLYGDTATYTSQLRALEGFVKEHPEDAGAHFVLGYHYLSTAHPDAAARQLAQVTQLMPNDKVAADLSRMLTTSDSQQSDSTAVAQVTQKPDLSNQPSPNPPATETQKTVDPKQLIGTWQASRDDGSKFEIALKDDSNFNWKFTPPKGKPSEFSGKYTVTGDVLSLEQESGGALVGQVNPEKSNEFHFKALGAPPEDPGLDFRK